jgi:outer membrane biosynthesis protein TonB
VPVRDRRPEDERPLFRAVNEQRLIGPVGGGQDSQEEPQGTGGSQTATQGAEASQGEKGPIATAIDKAEQNNWVYPSMAQMAREKGLLDKADEVLGKVKAQLGSK